MADSARGERHRGPAHAQSAGSTTLRSEADGEMTRLPQFPKAVAESPRDRPRPKSP